MYQWLYDFIGSYQRYRKDCCIGLKISLPSKCADVIIGDINILCNAPMRLMISGLGDMLAKYVSICEWGISALINGEYYCEKIVGIVIEALKICAGLRKLHARNVRNELIKNGVEL